MAKYRKKPVVIEAVQWNGHNRHELIEVLQVDPKVFVATSPLGESLFIQTLEGEMRAEKGDWIIKGVKGEVYPCKPLIFEATYEPA